MNDVLLGWFTGYGPAAGARDFAHFPLALPLLLALADTMQSEGVR
jgi:hypothetical protein